MCWIRSKYGVREYYKSLLNIRFCSFSPSSSSNICFGVVVLDMVIVDGTKAAMWKQLLENYRPRGSGQTVVFQWVPCINTASRLSTGKRACLIGENVIRPKFCSLEVKTKKLPKKSNKSGKNAISRECSPRAHSVLIGTNANDCMWVCDMFDIYFLVFLVLSISSEHTHITRC